MIRPEDFDSPGADPAAASPASPSSTWQWIALALAAVCVLEGGGWLRTGLMLAREREDRPALLDTLSAATTQRDAALLQLKAAEERLSASAAESRDGLGQIVGEWRGGWLSFAEDHQGFFYDVTLTLAPGADGAVEGALTWVLRRTPRPEEQGKVGLSAVEYVRGAYDGGGDHVLRLTGYRKDDPTSIIALDEYRLALSDNARVIGGITANHGTWRGVISLAKAE